MDLSSLGHLAVKHTRNAFAEDLYVRGLTDITRPTVVYGIVNERCNYKCRYCEYWRRDNYMDEMSIEEWQRALLSLHEFLGKYHVEFSGGEPFIKKGFVDLLGFCHAHRIGWGVTTNGSGLVPKFVEKIVEYRPFNMNISIDSNDPESHDYSRGVKGSFRKVQRGLELLIRQRDAAGLDFPIIIKPVVHRLNFRGAAELVRWAQDLGPTVVNFQPVDRWTSETDEELWIEEEDMDDLEGVVRELLLMKKKGAPILNNELVLNAWPMHFRGLPAPEETMPCLVGLRNYFIRPNGDVEVCWNFPTIGNVKTQSAREIWRGEDAALRRKETTSCEKLCLFTCLSQKTLKDKVKMGLTLIKRSSKQNAMSTRKQLKVVR